MPDSAPPPDPGETSLADRSAGYGAVAARFIAQHSATIGVVTVKAWMAGLPTGAAVLDLGCGHGRPITQTLVERGFSVHGIDASPRLIAEMRRAFSGVQAECGSVEDSAFFGRKFDGIVACGLLFLLLPETQAKLLSKVSRSLNPGGKFLFTAPRHACSWPDILTGRCAISLGREHDVGLLAKLGLILVGEETDEGGNATYFAETPAPSEAGSNQPPI